MTLALVIAAAAAALLALRVVVRVRQMRKLDRVSDRWLDEHHGGRSGEHP